MKRTVCVTGIGYVGLQLATSFDSNGHEVLAYDVDETRIDALSSGRDPTGEVGDEIIDSSSIEFSDQLRVLLETDAAGGVRLEPRGKFGDFWGPFDD